MKTTEVIEKEFREELKALLKKFNAELSTEACDHCGTRSKISVDIPGVYDKDGEIISQWTSINLGNFVE